MTTRKHSIHFAIGGALLIALPIAANDDHGKAEKVRADLSGYHEVPTNSSGGSAAFRARIANDDPSFGWGLAHSGVVNVPQGPIPFAAPPHNGPLATLP